ncbi:ABC transporter ATP-binding protein [Clostridium hydrogenum]|uniref:ABC transporter ATP-binding protein n=1 Tax=Clostridium hydrogenum TaxID=2855764 RepID=UPI001F2674D6|nr:ABC transporter ATP-binding protein [Clostridium hydrogenum]
METILKVENLNKKFKEFELGNVSFELPKGYTVGLVGANGAGKTTLLDLIMGFQKINGGSINYFNKCTSAEENEVKNRIGYVSDSNYFHPHWKVKNVATAMETGFDNFNKDKFYELVAKFEINLKKEILQMSKGTQMRLMLAAQLARATELLVLDEPASPLDPLMRDELCDLFREYVKDGEKTVFFSTHNIADMEYATDYVIVMKNGKIIEQGFVDDLKEKYSVVSGNSKEIDDIKKYFKEIRVTSMGFEGIVLSSDINRVVEEFDVAVETPSLQQIVVMLLKLKEFEG